MILALFVKVHRALFATPMLLLLGRLVGAVSLQSAVVCASIGWFAWCVFLHTNRALAN